MKKQDHLKVAELCFDFFERSTNKKNRRFWEIAMYESLLAWAGWKE